MISDTLFDAECEIVRYLTDSNFDSVYRTELRTEILKLLEQIDRVRMLPGMDTPPRVKAPKVRTSTEIIQSFGVRGHYDEI